MITPIRKAVMVEGSTWCVDCSGVHGTVYFRGDCAYVGNTDGYTLEDFERNFPSGWSGIVVLEETSKTFDGKPLPLTGHEDSRRLWKVVKEDSKSIG